MKKQLLLGALLTTLVVLPFHSAKAADATFGITVTVLDNLSGVTAQDMDFGIAAISGAGTLTLDTAGAISAVGAVSQYAGSPSQALINLSGTNNAVVDITLPTTVTLDDGTGNTLAVNNFVDDTGGTSQVTLDGSGAGALNIGADLVATGVVPDGTYTSANGSGDPTVALAYN